MKILPIILIFTLFTFSGFTQIIERQILNVSGGNIENPNIQISSSVGEAVIGSIKTGSLTVMQGFQHGGFERPTGLVEQREIRINYTIYPNPTYGQLNVEFDAEQAVELTLVLTDVQGNNLQSKSFAVDASLENHFNLNMFDLDEGLYLLRIQDPTGRQLQVFKVFKKK